MEMRGQLNAPATLSRNKISRYELDRRLAGLHSLLGCCEEKHLLRMSGIEYGGVYATNTRWFKYDRD
jgi:hypothetical protein